MTGSGSGPYAELRRKMRKGETPDYCEGCPVFVARSGSFDPDTLPVFVPLAPTGASL